MSFNPNPKLSDFQWKDYSKEDSPQRIEKELEQLQKAYLYLEEILSDANNKLASIEKNIGPILRCSCQSFFIEVDTCDTCHRPACSECITVISYKPTKLVCLQCRLQKRDWDEAKNKQK